MLIVTHSHLSKAFVETLKMINGGQVEDDVTAISLRENEGIYDYEQKVESYIQNIKGDLLVLADISFGSPARVVYEKLYSGGLNFRLIAGVNLAMVIMAFSMKEQGLDDVVSTIVEEGIQSITEVQFHDENKNEDDE